MRVLSLFDGIATGRLALEMAGVPVDLYIASEIDKDAKAVARANWPDMIHIGPVENVTAPDLPKIDLVIGGSPCQGFSRAGPSLSSTPASSTSRSTSPTCGTRPTAPPTA